MRVLLIGGTGTISSACAAQCVKMGMDVILLNRGKTSRPVPEAADVWQADYRNRDKVRSLLADQTFDVVVDFICFTEEDARRDAELFRDRTDHFIFISSASVYQTPPERLPVTEETILENPFWQYAREKIAAEDLFRLEYQEHDFPVTIVRPSHTYDRKTVPFPGRHLLFQRAAEGKKIVVHGDGTSLWTLTHHTDFAKGLCGLFGNDDAIGEAFHITSDEYLSWNQICWMLLDAAGLEAEMVHLPSEYIVRYDAEYGAGLLGDKAHSMIFDNAKIKQYVPEFTAEVPFSEGVKDIGQWYRNNAESLPVTAELDKAMDRMIADCESIFK